MTGQGKQPLSLHPVGCLYLSVIAHEIGHAIGFYHEQSRPDRNDYVTVIEENVHPGRILTKHGTKIYSDARVLTLLEIMILMTIPLNLDFPDNVSQSFIRSVIGEGIPPKFINLLMSELKR